MLHLSMDSHLACRETARIAPTSQLFENQVLLLRSPAPAPCSSQLPVMRTVGVVEIRSTPLAARKDRDDQRQYRIIEGNRRGLAGSAR
jgi:hypothetical protein